jgi:cyclophilin family peptidyl-prolyl cis-trans isomerase
MVHALFTTSEGNFKILLFEQEAPNTVANFTGLAEGTKDFTDPKTGQKTKRPFFDGLIFHRVIDGFRAAIRSVPEPEVRATNSPMSSARS